MQSLTLQPTVKDGRIIHEDSPLVCAVKTGFVLVVDEADKAPTNVTCVLKVSCFVYINKIIHIFKIIKFCAIFFMVKKFLKMAKHLT